MATQARRYVMPFLGSAFGAIAAAAGVGFAGVAAGLGVLGAASVGVAQKALKSARGPKEDPTAPVYLPPLPPVQTEEAQTPITPSDSAKKRPAEAEPEQNHLTGAKRGRQTVARPPITPPDSTQKQPVEAEPEEDHLTGTERGKQTAARQLFQDPTDQPRTKEEAIAAVELSASMTAPQPNELEGGDFVKWVGDHRENLTAMFAMAKDRGNTRSFWYTWANVVPVLEGTGQLEMQNARLYNFFRLFQEYRLKEVLVTYRPYFNAATTAFNGVYGVEPVPEGLPDDKKIELFERIAPDMNIIFDKRGVGYPALDSVFGWTPDMFNPAELVRDGNVKGHTFSSLMPFQTTFNMLVEGAVHASVSPGLEPDTSTDYPREIGWMATKSSQHGRLPVYQLNLPLPQFGFYVIAFHPYVESTLLTEVPSPDVLHRIFPLGQLTINPVWEFRGHEFSLFPSVFELVPATGKEKSRNVLNMRHAGLLPKPGGQTSRGTQDQSPGHISEESEEFWSRDEEMRPAAGRLATTSLGQRSR